MGAGRKSVCFETIDELAAAAVPVEMGTKNTFVHFQTRDTFARRGTFSGGLLALRRGSWNEADVGARRRASRGARAVTCQPNLAVVVQIPELRRGSLCSEASELSDVSPCRSVWTPKSPLSVCLETPTMLMIPRCPSPVPSVFASPCSPCSPYSPLPQGCFSGFATPCAPPSPRFDCGFLTPSSPATFYAPQCFQAMPQAWSPQTSPQTSPRDFPETWQPLQAPKKRSKRGKAPAPPAQPNELTVMLRHLPLDMSPDALLAKFADFIPFIDFYYLPTNFETKKNLGYGFLNFTDRSAAARFTSFWEQSGVAESDDTPVQEARVQGFVANVERFRSSSVMGVLSEELKPRIFCRGVPQPFPVADKPLPAVGPRFRPTGQ